MMVSTSCTRVAVFILLLLGICAGCKTDNCDEFGEITEFEQQSIDFFEEIVMTDEDNDTFTERPLRRWVEPMKIYLASDLPPFLDSALVHVVDTLNILLQDGGIEIVEEEFDSNAQLYYMTNEEYNSLVHTTKPIPQTSNGRIRIWWRANVIYRARIFISSEIPSNDYSVHVLYEEITQGLGPITDTHVNSNSIFYEGYPTFPSKPQLFPIDKELLRNLYSDYVSPGMNTEEVREALEEHYLCKD